MERQVDDDAHQGQRDVQGRQVVVLQRDPLGDVYRRRPHAQVAGQRERGLDGDEQKEDAGDASPLRGILNFSAPVDRGFLKHIASTQVHVYLGIGAKDFTAVYSTLTFQANGMQGPPQLTWYFSLTTPFSQFQQTFARLLAAAAPTAATKDLTVSFSISSASAAQATIDQAANRSIPDLIADARIRAKRLADAAGLTVGVILELNDGQYGSGGAAYAVFNGGLGGFSSPKLTVSATVRFALLRYSSN